MSDENVEIEKTYTLEELRDAFWKGAARQGVSRSKHGTLDGYDLSQECERLYPDPTPPKKLREVRTSNGCLYRVVDGVLQFRRADLQWREPASTNANDVRTLHDLIANPYEKE